MVNSIGHHLQILHFTHQKCLHCCANHIIGGVRGGQLQGNALLNQLQLLKSVCMLEGYSIMEGRRKKGSALQRMTKLSKLVEESMTDLEPEDQVIADVLVDEGTKITVSSSQEGSSGPIEPSVPLLNPESSIDVSCLLDNVTILCNK